MGDRSPVSSGICFPPDKAASAVHRIYRNRIETDAMKTVIFGFCAVVLPFFIVSVSSCSLDYGKNIDAEESVPELLFANADLKTYNDGKLSVELKANRMEQYSTNNILYAVNVVFNTWNKKQEADTEGSCDLLTADRDLEQYTFLHNIKIYNRTQNTRILAQNLHWDGKTEQLTSGTTDMITVSKDKTTLTGSGFSASGISGKFRFTGKVRGTIIEDETEHTADDK